VRDLHCMRGACSVPARRRFGVSRQMEMVWFVVSWIIRVGLLAVARMRYEEIKLLSRNEGCLI
jgi:hypothetical protein